MPDLSALVVVRDSTKVTRAQNSQKLFVIFHVPAARSAPSLTRGKGAQVVVLGLRLRWAWAGLGSACDELLLLKKPLALGSKLCAVLST